MTKRAPVIVSIHCAHCHAAIELECEGLPVYPGYYTFNEFTCPHCRKLNHPRTPGAIVAVRKAA
jgi:hypothetical protein